MKYTFIDCAHCNRSVAAEHNLESFYGDFYNFSGTVCEHCATVTLPRLEDRAQARAQAKSAAVVA